MTRISPLPCPLGRAQTGPLRRLRLTLVVAGVMASTVTLAVTAGPVDARSSIEATMANEVVASLNAERAARGIAPLKRISDSHAQSTAAIMRDIGGLQHSFDLGVYPAGAKENIGASSGSASGRVPTLWMASTGHRAAMLAKDADQVAVGVACAGETAYVVAHMVSSSHSVAQKPTSSNPPTSPVVTNANSGTRCQAPAAPSTAAGTDTVAVVRGRNVILRSTNGATAASSTVTLPEVPDQVFSGDWNGDNVDTVGYRKGNVMYLLSANATGASTTSFSYGRVGDVVVIGDWNGNGIDTVGVRRANVFYLRNKNSAGVAHIVLAYGQAADAPVVGDWNGDGTDTFGVRRDNAFYLRNGNTTGVAHIVLAYGTASDTPVVGDWNGDGADTFGVRRGTQYLLRNRNSTGVADLVFNFGAASDLPLSGDWNGT